MREVRGLRAACSAASNWKRTPLCLSNTHGRTRDRHLWGSPESERGFLEQAWRFVFETRTHNSLVYPAEDVHRRLNVDEHIGKIGGSASNIRRSASGTCSG